MTKLRNRKIIVAALAVVVVAGIALGGRAIVSAASRDEAKQTALGSVPAGVTLVEQDEDDGKYEFTFRTADGTTEYEVEVSKSSGEVKELHTALRNDRGAEEATLAEADAIKAVQEAWAGASINSIQLVKDDGRYLYEVRFEADDCYGSAEVHAGTGVIVESDVKMGAPVVVPTTSPANEAGETEAAVYLTTAQVKELALARVSDGTIREVDFDRENGKYIYEVDIYKDGTKYELTYDAITGEELRCETEKDSWNATPVTTAAETTAAVKETETPKGSNTSKETTAAVKESQAAEKDVIGKDKAKSIALGKAEGADAKITEIYLDWEDGRRVYEGEMRDDTYEYDFDIDAYTGTVVKWEKERLERRASATVKETTAAVKETTAAVKETTAAAKETTAAEVISEDKARSIALGKAKADGAVIEYIKLEKDDGRRVYEGEMRDNSYEYDFEIDAYTGTVTDWDVDNLDWD